MRNSPSEYGLSSDTDGRLNVAPALAALLFLAGAGIMARATVADAEAFPG